MKYFVHRYDVVRVKVAVEADDQKRAMIAADEYLALNHPLINKYSHMEGDQYPAPKWLEIEGAEEITGYLVDEVGDEEYSKTRSYDSAGHPYIPAWSDADNYPREAWRLEVADENTQLGYAEWVSHQLESENG